MTPDFIPHWTTKLSEGPPTTRNDLSECLLGLLWVLFGELSSPHTTPINIELDALMKAAQNKNDLMYKDMPVSTYKSIQLVISMLKQTVPKVRNNAQNIQATP